ncbi:erythromycin esterase family protein [Nocardia seriolae]|uniref:erythromycin esterase family protein n=1 Tax=Nocardia seriolae TaxID=37332 RepID=UPI0009F62DA8
MEMSALSGATVVGIGESTRFAHETFALRDEVFRALVERHGFRTLAVQDSANVGEALAAFVRTGEGSAGVALANAWRPWRTREMVGTLEWVREFNRMNAGDEVSIIGIKPVQAEQDDYEVVLDAVRAHAPGRLAQIAGHLEPIRTAHVVDEHVQRARGCSSGPSLPRARPRCGYGDRFDRRVGRKCPCPNGFDRGLPSPQRGGPRELCGGGRGVGCRDHRPLPADG